MSGTVPTTRRRSRPCPTAASAWSPAARAAADPLPGAVRLAGSLPCPQRPPLPGRGVRGPPGPGNHRPRLSQQLPGRLQVSRPCRRRCAVVRKPSGAAQQPGGQLRDGRLPNPGSPSSCGRRRLPARRPLDDQDVAAGLVGRAKLPPVLAGPGRRPLARPGVALVKAGKAHPANVVVLDVDRGQGLAPDQPTVGTGRPLAGRLVGHGGMLAVD
jgi:hypothetical protein